MKRVRTKETIGNNKKCSKKHDEAHLFPSIPPDLIVEILLKVPARSIAKFVFVSKLWSSIISDKGFTKLYLSRTLSRPRLLFVAYDFNMGMIKFLQSCSQEDPSSDHHRVNITPHTTNYCGLSPPVRGLICCQKDTKVMIGNPSTGQFLTLPNVESNRMFLFSYFGYDPVNDVYKVLCMTVPKVHHRRRSRFVSEEFQVFTLGAKQNWRRIECKHHHLPINKGICRNGVVYYYAWVQSEGSLISFDLISEEFNVIMAPEDTQNLVNYNGKLALTSQRCSGTLNLWVPEDACKQEWSEVSLVVPSWTDLVGKNPYFRFRGTLSTGELIFSPFFPRKPFFFISFDLKKNNAKKVVVGGLGDDCYMFEVYGDHVEIPLVL